MERIAMPEYTMYEIYEGNSWQHDVRRVNIRIFEACSAGWFNHFRIEGVDIGIAPGESRPV